MEELSGLSFNQDRTALLACGDKGTVKEGELDSLSAKDIDIMNMLLTRKRAKMQKLYAVASEISK